MKICGGNGDGERKGGDLSERVNAGVGAAGALGEDGFAGDVVDGAGEGALNGGEVGLDLPAVVGRSVVGEGCFPVRHGDVRTVSRRLAHCRLWHAVLRLPSAGTEHLV